MTKIDK